jgi:hypothetical protein
MPGNIFAKERAANTLTSAGSSLTNGSGGSAGTDLDLRSAGNSAQDFSASFELTCQWATVTGIVAGTVVADIFAVPKLDGTNASQQVDTTAGSSFIPYPCRVGVFIAAKAPSTNTDTRFFSGTIALDPLLYTMYIINRSGQTISSNWTLKEVGAQTQYS